MSSEGPLVCQTFCPVSQKQFPGSLNQDLPVCADDDPGRWTPKTHFLQQDCGLTP